MGFLVIINRIEKKFSWKKCTFLNEKNCNVFSSKAAMKDFKTVWEASSSVERSFSSTLKELSHEI
jgi:hypothetical protein